MPAVSSTAAHDARPATGHLAFLDGLRGYAILLVVLIHASQGIAGAAAIHSYVPGLHSDIVLPGWLSAICRSAGHGVQLFFVVSAASLTLSGLASPNASLSGYAWRRFLRLAPMFYLAIVGYTAAIGLGPRLWAPAGIGASDVLATFAFVHGWFPTSFNSVVPGGWSIANEAVFYVLLPLLLVLLRRSIAVFAALTLFCLIAVQTNYALHVQRGTWGAFEHFGFFNQAPVFLIGMLTGWWMYRLRPRWGMAGTPAGITAFIAAAGLLPVVREFVQALAPTLDSALLRGPVLFFLFVQPHIWFALLAAVLCIALTHRASLAFTNAAITSLGRCSFSIYLVHFALLHPVHAAVGSLTDERGVGFLALYYASLLVCSWAIAAMSYRFVEVPFIQLGRRLSQSSSMPRLAPQRQS